MKSKVKERKKIKKRWPKISNHDRRKKGSHKLDPVLHLPN